MKEIMESQGLNSMWNSHLIGLFVATDSHEIKYLVAVCVLVMVAHKGLCQPGPCSLCTYEGLWARQS